MSTQLSTSPVPETLQRVRNRISRTFLIRAAMAVLITVALGTQLIYEIQKSQRQPEIFARSISTVVGDFIGTFTYLTSACVAVGDC